MMVDILIKEKNGDRGFYVPWLPDEIEFSGGNAVTASYDILSRGPVEVPTGTELKEISWKSLFPGVNRIDSGMLRTSYRTPQFYHSVLEDWRAKGTTLTLMVFCYPINMDVILAEYTATASGGFGDWEYEIKFREKRELTLWPILPKEMVKTSFPDQSAEPQRAATSDVTYTIRYGDSPWRIAAQQLGNGLRWPEIIELNQEILESTAQKYGQHCTVNDPHIYAGTVIALPAK